MPPDDRNEQASIIIRRRNGTLTPLHTRRQGVTTAEDGSLQWTNTETLQETADGAILRAGEYAYQCAKCPDERLWSRRAMKECVTCNSKMCVLCTKTTPKGTECKPCADEAEQNACEKYLKNPFV